jgi:alginate O-acetyltransferase complex protein AlgI
MAIGMGKMLGFTFLDNFNFPMASKTVSDFWRRWHMSLTTWFKDYVYIPLGGSRCSKIKNIRNLLIVWILTGFWHGASWNFVVWGLYFGIILILEKFVINKYLESLPSFFKHLYTSVIVTVGWAIFALEDFSVMTEYIGKMFINRNIIDNRFLFYCVPYIPFMLVAVLFAVPLYGRFTKAVDSIKNGPAKVLVNTSIAAIYCALTVLCIALLVGNAYNPFLYFRF